MVLPDAGAKKAHDDWRYAAARRVGDMIYVSGVIVYRDPGEGNDVAAFKLQARRALERLRVILEAAGTDFQHVAMINSFHVWQGPNFAGTRDEQFQAFEDVIGEFMKAPYPAWTAVGTTGPAVGRRHHRSAAHRQGCAESQVVVASPFASKSGMSPLR